MRRGLSYVLVSLVVLAGCGGPTGEEGGTVPTFTSDPTGSADPSVVPTEPGSTSVPPETGGTSAGATENTGDPGGEEQSIEVAGPTLDNTFPTNPFALPWEGGSSCVVFTNRTSSVPVTVREVALVEQQPSSDPGLALGPNPSAHPQCSSAHPGIPEEVEDLQQSCTGATLDPGARSGCPVEVRSVGSVGTDYTATLVLRLSATCTSLDGDPCAELAGQADPTATDPVTVTWTASRNYCSCLVPRDRGGGEFLPEEGEGRCPPEVEPSESTSPSQPVPEETDATETSSPSPSGGPSS